MRLRAAIQRAQQAERRAARLAVLLHEQTETLAAHADRLERLQRANEDWERRCSSCERTRGLQQRDAPGDPWSDVEDGWAQ